MRTYERLVRYTASLTGPAGPRIVSAAIILALLPACGVSGPEQGVPDVPPPPVLGVDSVVIGATVFRCGRFVRPVSDVEGWAILDVTFRRPTQSDPDDRPIDEFLELFVDQGAQVLHLFNFPRVRAVVRLDALPDLWPSIVDYANEVPYSDRFDVPAGLVFGSGSAAEWTELVEGVGGSVKSIYEGFSILYADIPDSTAPTLRQHPSVELVELDGQFCS